MSLNPGPGGAITVEAPEAIAALLRRHGIDPSVRYLAVAVNGAVVRRSDWTTHMAQTGDTVEVVRPFQGG